MSQDRPRELGEIDNLPYELLDSYEVYQQQGVVNRRKLDLQSGRGDNKRILTNMFMGYNHRMAPAPAAKNREVAGLTFFSRGDMNLSLQNLVTTRRMNELAKALPNTMEAGITVALDALNDVFAADPSLIQLGSNLKEGVPYDNKQAFIPLLTNTLLSVSGFPDQTLDSYVSDEGIRREQIAFVDSTYEVNNAFTLNATFRNIYGDPVTKMFTTWLEYMSAVALGDMSPRPRNIYGHEVDYQTRIIRFRMDPSLRYITKWGAAIAAYPTNDNLGAAMNVDMSSPFLNDLDNINIQFQCVGAEYCDPILLQEFNDLVCHFNIDMLPHPDSPYTYLPYGKDRMRKLQRHEIIMFNYYAYPHVNMITKELEWYIYNDEYDRLMSEIQND